MWLTGLASLQGSISDGSNVLEEVPFPARVLKSYSVRKTSLLISSHWLGG